VSFGFVWSNRRRFGGTLSKHWGSACGDLVLYWLRLAKTVVAFGRTLSNAGIRSTMNYAALASFGQIARVLVALVVHDDLLRSGYAAPDFVALHPWAATG
jgi:hypothetical protein